MLCAAVASRASVIDAPHNSSNGISCTTCHSYSLWWQYSPATTTSTPDKATVVNAVCSTCHGAGGTAPQAVTHSSTTIGSTTYGTWSQGCTDCHNPHYQSQLAWIGTTPSPYLVTGSISSVTYDSVANQSTITYAGATSNTNWPVTAWNNKSLANPSRGLIFVQDQTLASNTYSIVSATATQVVVKGQIDPNSVNPAYINPTTNVQNAPTCNTFGLIYGQLISNS
ncbi:MAG: cytochrome c3 family protein, partial [Desulfobacteraceae bacterium]|nr:cytochrome c3 family protein [Desulfobacteraceae bacterium]